jgi:hypothetical protein
MILAFATIGGVVAFIPGASFILIPMELIMLYKIATKYNAFEFFPFIIMAGTLVTISLFLKGLAAFLYPVPVIGELANSLVAFGFIFVVGMLADKYYANRSSST